MDNSAVQRIQDVLGKSKSIAVALGTNPSIDEMGAALALYLSLQQMGKNITVVSPTPPIVELSNLVGIDKVKTRYEGEGVDLVVSFPYREGEIEKVSYTIENGYLNIVVKTGEQGLTFSEQDVKYTRGNNGGQLDLLFVIGTPRLSAIHDVFTPEMLKNVTLVNIDNKQDNQGFGDIVLVSPRFSSVSEQMTQLLSDLRTPVDNDIAQNLLDGIMFATESFQSPKTSYLAFEMAGILMRQGAVRQAGVQAGRPQKQDFIQVPVSQPQQQPIRRPQHQQDRRTHYDQRRQPQRPQQQHGQGYQQRQAQPQPQQPVPQQRPQPQQQSRSQPTQPEPQQPQQPSRPQPQPEPQQPHDSGDLNPPTDWLTPKVYKGSSNV